MRELECVPYLSCAPVSRANKLSRTWERHTLFGTEGLTGLICDQTIVLTGSHKGFQIPLRRIRFKDPKTGKRLILLTNIVDTELDERLK